MMTDRTLRNRICIADRWVRSMVVAVLAIAGLTHVVRAEAVRTVRAPLLLEVKVADVRHIVDLKSDDAAAFRTSIVKDATRRAKAQPGRIVTLRLDGVPLEWSKLSPSQRRIARKAMPARVDAASWYSESLSAFLVDIVVQTQGAVTAPVSVAGVPVERGNPAAKAAFDALAQQLDALVLSRSFVVTSNRDSLATVKAASPRTFAAAGNRPVLYLANRSWQAAFLTATPAAPSGLSEPVAAGGGALMTPIQQLLADWGESDSPWDLDGDGIVGMQDLLILLASIEDDDGSGEPTGPPPTGEGPGYWISPPGTYTLGSTQDISFEVTEPGLENPNVVFQVWSVVSQSVEAPFPDPSAPFVYPGASLDGVTPGAGEIQAIVRNELDEVVGVVVHEVTFEAQTPGTGTGGGSWEEFVIDTGSGMPVVSTVSFVSGGQGPDDDATSTPPGGGGQTTPPTSPPPGGGSGGSTGEEVEWGDPDAPSPQPVIHILDDQGMAPFAVHVHALDSNLGVGNELTARFQWSFGDPNGAHNELEGWNAAHIYDEPGTYTVTLTIMNEGGKQASVTKDITVQPDTRTKLYVSAAGSDSASGASPSTPIKTFAEAMSRLDDNMNVLLRRGDTFNVSSATNVDETNWTLGAYGTGGNPKLKWTGGLGYSSIIAMDEDEPRDVVIQDLTFDSQYASFDGRDIVDAMKLSGENITVRRCTFKHVTIALNENRDPVGVLSYDNVAPEPNALRAYYVWAEGSDQTHIGNTIDGSMHEHNIRLGGANRVLIARNHLTNEPKRCIWAMLGSHCYIAENTLSDGRLTVGPNHAVGGSSDRFKYCVIERNEIDKTSGATPAIELEHGAEHVIVRNNVIKTHGGIAISVDGYDSDMNRTCVDSRIYNNTAINDSSYGRFVECGGDSKDTAIANNLYISPALETGQYNNAILYILDPDLSNFVTICNNVWPVPADFHWVDDGYHYLWAYWSSAEGYKSPSEWETYDVTLNESYQNLSVDDTYQPADGSAAENHAIRLPGIFTDYHGIVRPASGVWTAGAVEMSE